MERQQPLQPSERFLLGSLFRRQSVTQGELTRWSGLTQQSVSRLISGLTARGMVEAGLKVDGVNGYKTASHRLSGGFATSLGISVGGGAVALVLLDFAGNLVETRKAGLISPSVDTVVTWVRAFIDERTEQGFTAPVGVGVALAGSFIDERTFNTPHYLEDWAQIDVAETLRAAFGLPVFADNNGNTAALLESVRGVGRWAPSFAYLYLSSGVGGGVILDGEPWRGRMGNAGEFAGGLPPNIYPFPNLELLRILLGKSGPSFDGVEEMVNNYDPSWPAIEDWVSRVRDSVSIIASNATAILDLDAIVIGGLTPSDLATRLIARVELFDQRRRAVGRPMARLVASELLENPAATGAAMLPLRHAFFINEGPRAVPGALNVE